MIFVIFILMQMQDLRNRLVQLAGSQDLQRTTAAIDDAGQRLSRLFLTQLALNAGFGVVIGAGLWVIGVPSAALWGMLAMILRFVPISARRSPRSFPSSSRQRSDRIGPWCCGPPRCFLVVEPLLGRVLEPLLYAHGTGLSPVAVIASATFWTWLWGPIGLILATPLTICLVVLGRYVDRLKFLDVMFGDEPALTPAELVYQRMLARDPVEAAEQARNFLKQKPLLVILRRGFGSRPAACAERTPSVDCSTRSARARIRDAVAEIIDDLSTHEDNPEPPPAEEAATDDETPLAQINKAEEVTR